MENNLWGQETKLFNQLTPEQIMEVAEIFGSRLTGKVLPLNSIENRVYEVELASPYDFGPGFSSLHLIIKFYRPGRWNKDQLLDEHRFLLSLSEYEVPVVAPLCLGEKEDSLFFDKNTQLYFALFPKLQGRLKDELLQEEIDQAGRLIGRIHNIGSHGTFQHRLTFHPELFIQGAKINLIESQIIESESLKHYLNLLDPLTQLTTPLIEGLLIQKIHGDFHRGNIVWTSHGPVAVDFDDILNGPIEQDLWLLFPGTDPDSLKDRERFLRAYCEMTRRDYVSLRYLEVFRTMRMVHFNGWIAKRWSDHSFQQLFPQFTSANYWDQQLIDLRMQMSSIQEINYY